MKDEKKSIIEEALAEFNLIEETLSSNAKEILRSVAKEEITSTLNESLNEDEYDIEDIEDVDTETDVDALPIDDAPVDDIGGSEELGLDDIGMDSGEEELEIGLGAEEGSEDYGMDMTGASDEEVISVYKKLQGEDEIEVVSSEEVIIKDPVSGAEYNVKMGGGSMLDQGEMDAEGGFGDEIGIEAEPEAEFEPEVAPEVGAEVGAEPAPEFGGGEEEAEVAPEVGAEDTEEEEDDDLGEAVVYEIELSEDEEITEGLENNLKINKDSKIGNTADGKPRTADSDRGTGKDTPSDAPNTGDIESQTAPEDSDSGDNLKGGFDEKHNGKGGNHANHVMEGEDEVSESEEVNETEEFPTSSPEALPAKEKTEAQGNAHADHVMESEEVTEGDDTVTEEDTIEEGNEVIDEEVVEEEETIDEHIPKGVGEAHRQPAKADIGQPVGTGAKGVPGVKGENVEGKKLLEAVKNYNTLLAEAQALKEENVAFKSSLKDFKRTMTETAIFNINLTHATKLFLEHSTTIGEKKDILTRFDEEVNTIAESKKLYKKINSELGTQKPISASIENKLVSEQTSGQSAQINETVAYVDPAQKRVLDLINRTK